MGTWFGGELADLLPNELGPTRRVTYRQPTVENCGRRAHEEFNVDGNDIIVTVTLMQHPETPWSVPCDDEVVEVDTVKQLGSSLERGETYRVVSNDELVMTITYH